MDYGARFTEEKQARYKLISLKSHVSESTSQL